MKTIYISGGITGVENYMDKFNKAEHNLKTQGYVVVNPAKILDMLPVGTLYKTYMDASIAILSNCDAIYMLSGWENSKGACHEHNYAKTYDLEIYYE